MKLYRILYPIFAGLILAMSACTPEEYSLDKKDITPDDLAAGIAYSVTPDALDPNKIYLKSLLGPEYTPLWEHPQGRSQDSEVVLQIPFKGSYTVQFGVMTRGGYVYGEPYTFDITTDNLSYVNDPVWNMLTGGVGNSKTWVIDLDGAGKVRYFSGPIWFWTAGFTWDALHNKDGLTYLDKGWDANDAIAPFNEWYWTAEWPGNDWITGAGDFGTMTFDLIDGAHVQVMQSINGGADYNGQFSVNSTAHTIDFSDAYPLCLGGYISGLLDTPRHYQILYLTDDAMQLLIEFANGDTPITVNYVRQGYEPEETPVEPKIELKSDWRDYVEPKTSKLMNYKMDEETPFDWAAGDGTLKEISGIKALEDLADVSLSFNTGEKTFSFMALDGTTYEGSYDLDNSGVYTFNTDIEAFDLSDDGTASFHLNSDRTLSIVKYEVDDYTGSLSDLWLGSKEVDDQGNLVQYMTYHFKLKIAGAADEIHLAAYMYFNNSGWGWNHEASDFDGDANARSAKVDITGDGLYTFEFGSEFAESDMYLAYIDIYKILKKYPNADATIVSIKVDGNEIEFVDEEIDRMNGDVETTLRRYVLNPWGDTNYFNVHGASLLSFTQSLAITVDVKLDTGIPYNGPAE